MGQTQDKSRKPIDDWGTTTQKVTMSNIFAEKMRYCLKNIYILFDEY